MKAKPNKYAAGGVLFFCAILLFGSASTLWLKNDTKSQAAETSSSNMKSVDLTKTSGVYDSNFSKSETAVTVTDSCGGLRFELPEPIAQGEKVAITIEGTLPTEQQNRVYLVPTSLSDVNNQVEGVSHNSSKTLPNTWTVTAGSEVTSSGHNEEKNPAPGTGATHFQYKGPAGGSLQKDTVITGITVEYLGTEPTSEPPVVSTEMRRLVSPNNRCGSYILIHGITQTRRKLST